MELRPFDQHDWDGFAGCDSKFPFMGESIDVFSQSNKKWQGIAVIDANMVQIYAYAEDTDGELNPDEMVWCREFETTEEAITFMMRIDNQVTEEYLTEHKFRVILSPESKTRP